MPSHPCRVESCVVPANDPVFRDYHDHEWGVPQSCDRLFFEKLCLEGFQSGLSWRTILHKRAAFREAFKQFNLQEVASFTSGDVQRLLGNPHIIRNQRKILSAINNARQALSLQQRYGSLAAYFWQFEPMAAQRPDNVTLQWLAHNASTEQSKKLAQCLKQTGFSYVGPTNMYALMQALGIVNDHVAGCPRREQITQLRLQFVKPIVEQSDATPEHIQS